MRGEILYRLFKQFRSSALTLAVFSSFAAIAADSVWTGATSTDWATPSNWENGVVPSTDQRGVTLNKTDAANYTINFGTTQYTASYMPIKSGLDAAHTYTFTASGEGGLTIAPNASMELTGAVDIGRDFKNSGGALILESGKYTFDALNVGWWWTDGFITINENATLTVNETVSLGNDPGTDNKAHGTGTLTMNGGILNLGGALAVGNGYNSQAPGLPATGIVNQVSGTISSTSYLGIGHNENHYGIYNMQGGRATFGGCIVVGRHTGSYGELNISGGYMESASGNELQIGQGNSSTGRVVVTGGALVNRENWFCIGHANGSQTYLEIDGGVVSNICETAACNFTLSSTGDADSRAELKVKSGELYATRIIYIGELHSATAEISGGHVYAGESVCIGSSVPEGESATLTFKGGTIETDHIYKGTYGSLDIQGGTFKAIADEGNYFENCGELVLAQGNNLTFDTAGHAVTIQNNISGAGGIVKEGEGTLTLSGTVSVTGNIVINGGVLVLNGITYTSANSPIGLNGGTWTGGGATGAWTTIGNWSQGRAPASGTATFGALANDAQHTVDFGSEVVSGLSSLTFNNGNAQGDKITFTASNGGGVRLDTTGNAIIGNEQDGTASLELAAGTYYFATDTGLGAAGGAKAWGDLYIGSGATMYTKNWLYTGRGAAGSGGDIHLNGGALKTGYLFSDNNYATGGEGAIKLGEYASTTGRVYQTGGTAEIKGGDINLGTGTGAYGLWEQSGGTVDATGAIYVGRGASALGEMTLGGTSVSSGNEITLGYEAASTGTVSQTAANVTSGGALNLASGAGAKASWTQSGGALSVSGTFAIASGADSEATFSRTGGTLSIGATSVASGARAKGTLDIGDYTGNLALGNDFVIAGGNCATGVVRIAGSGDLTASVVNVGGGEESSAELEIGGSRHVKSGQWQKFNCAYGARSKGKVVVQDNAKVTTDGDNVCIGVGNGSYGELLVKASAEVTSSWHMYVPYNSANNATGIVHQTGGKVKTGDGQSIYLGEGSANTARYLLTAGEMESGSSLLVGSGAGSYASFAATNATVKIAGNLDVATAVGSTGFVSIAQSSLSSGSTWNVASGEGAVADVTLDNATVLSGMSGLCVGSGANSKATVRLKGTSGYLTGDTCANIIGNASGAEGRLEISETAQLSSTWHLYVGGNANNNATGTIVQTGGSVIVRDGWQNVVLGSGENSKGVYNMSGGSLVVQVAERAGGATDGTGDIVLGDASGGEGEMTVSGTAHILASNIRLCNADNTKGTFNLNGGTIEVWSLKQSNSAGGSSAACSFNGGTIKARGTNYNLIDTSLTPVLSDGGLVVDTDDYYVCIPAKLTGEGGVTKVGTGVLNLQSEQDDFTGELVVSNGILNVAKLNVQDGRDLKVGLGKNSSAVLNIASCVRDDGAKLHVTPIINPVDMGYPFPRTYAVVTGLSGFESTADFVLPETSADCLFTPQGETEQEPLYNFTWSLDAYGTLFVTLTYNAKAIAYGAWKGDASGSLDSHENWTCMKANGDLLEGAVPAEWTTILFTSDSGTWTLPASAAANFPYVGVLVTNLAATVESENEVTLDATADWSAFRVHMSDNLTLDLASYDLTLGYYNADINNHGAKVVFDCSRTDNAISTVTLGTNNGEMAGNAKAQFQGKLKVKVTGEDDTAFSTSLENTHTGGWEFTENNWRIQLKIDSAQMGTGPVVFGGNGGFSTHSNSTKSRKMSMYTP